MTTMLHPILVHFPIALWITALVMWAYALARESEEAWRCGGWLQCAAFGGAALSIGSGWIASEGLGHGGPGHDLVHTHRNLMLVASALDLALVAALLRVGSGTPRARQGLTALSLVVVLVAAVGADRGGQLVYDYGVGVARDTQIDADVAADHAAHEHGTHEHGTHEPDAHDHSESGHAAHAHGDEGVGDTGHAH